MSAVRMSADTSTFRHANNAGSSNIAISQRGYSSALPLDVIKDSIKSSLLEEASKKDSSFWDENQTADQTMNGINGSHQKVDIEKRLSDVVDVDTPINKPDPLDEWYLDAVSSTTRDMNGLNGLGAGKITANIPEGVASLDAYVNDPFILSRPDVHDISETIEKDLVGTDHPVLNSAARYFFNSEDGKGKGKQVRPVMVMLMSSMSRAMMHIDSGLETSSPGLTHVLKSQRRLVEITEMIHIASLFHDDVIDEADTRQGQPLSRDSPFVIAQSIGRRE